MIAEGKTLDESKAVYVEGNSGASGDMLLSALIDLGFPIGKLNEIFADLPVRAEIANAKQGSMAVSALKPYFPKAGKKIPRDLAGFVSLIDLCILTSQQKEKCKKIVNRLAHAEGVVHGKPPKKIHFHEIGGLDTILDIAGFVAGADYLGISKISVGPLNVGGGLVNSRHGKLPVPAPASAQLLTGFNIFSSGIKTELVTPTAAAIFAELGKPVQSMPQLSLEKIGVGAGAKKLPFPNILRLFLGTETAANRPAAEPGLSRDLILKLEANIDDMNPLFWESVFDRLYEKGALEAFVTPVIMKKSRPSHLLTVLSPPDKESQLREVIFEETTTLGIRKELIQRVTLNRKMASVKTEYGEVPFKIAFQNGKILNVSPEYDHLKKIAKNKKVPIKKVYHAAIGQLPWPEKRS